MFGKINQFTRLKESSLIALVLNVSSSLPCSHRLRLPCPNTKDLEMKLLGSQLRCSKTELP